MASGKEYLDLIFGQIKDVDIAYKALCKLHVLHVVMIKI